MIIQYFEYNKSIDDYENQQSYNLFCLPNLLLFIIIYIVSTVGLFYLNISNINLFSFLETPTTTTTNNYNNNNKNIIINKN